MWKEYYTHDELEVGMKVRVNLQGVLRQMDLLDVEDERYHTFVETEIIEIDHTTETLKVEYEVYEFEPTTLPFEAVKEVIEPDGRTVPVML